MTIVLHCPCGARERIHTSRALAASWADHSYTCAACTASAPADNPFDGDLARLMAEPARDELAAAL